MDAINLKQPELYINRELSMLEFNRRVIEQAKDTTVPLLERLRFLCIASTNLDEFFEIRVSGLNQQVKYGSVQTGSDNLPPAEVLNRISRLAHELVADQYRVLNEILIPELADKQIRILRRKSWRPKLSRWVKRYFNRELLPVLSPIGLDPAHPFPRVLNKNLYFIVSLEGKDAFGRDSGYAIVQAPRSLPRIIPVPKEQATGQYDFILLSSIIHAHVDDLFPGMKTTGCYQFRVTRDSDLFVDDEEVDDLLRALEGELPSRRFSDAVRLEVADNCPPDITNFLLHHFGLNENALYQVNGPVNLNRLLAIHDLVNRPDLIYPGFIPELPRRLVKHTNIFETLRNGDILLYHPFQSFVPVIDFLRQAAADASVLSIKQTLYRTGNDSAVVEVLKEAARAGKEVTVVIELRARFDEEANIELASNLQEAGAHVVYGVVGYKTHAKMILVIRREGRQLRRYVHLGTGNYHARTARLYTDYGLLTCDNAIGEDVNKLFLQLTGLGRASKLKKLLQSPFTMHKSMMSYIQYETKCAMEGREAKIIAKMNALVDPEITRALYEASRAGVKIELIIRGICCLRPGVPDISENIQVRSIVGRFLEHTRVFYFFHGGEEIIICSSADWMQRNFFHRVETCFPIEEKRPRDQIIKFGLINYLSDNTQAWLLQADGTYKKIKPGSNKPRSAQEACLEQYCQ
ncbi:MAG: RNA degradosome polyphosphate kinase [Gammaproteobacteria bacterium RBG_16_51_14]|nr:MAG: RNA degradosome polyphosphate kinase [Gammaproteobacteria bacterium RBG_16_51_14]